MKECYGCKKVYEANAGYCYDCEVKVLGSERMFKFQGMGGWLLFFVILGVLGIIINAVTAFQNIGALSTLRTMPGIELNGALPILVINAVLIFVTVALFSVSLVQLCGRKSRFFFLYQLSFFVGFVGGILAFVGIGMVTFEGRSIDIPPGTIRDFVISILWFILLTAYYSNSVRVRIFMETTDYLKQAIFAFKRDHDPFITLTPEDAAARAQQNDTSTAHTPATYTSAQNTNFINSAYKAATLITCKGCEKSYTNVRDTCPFCKAHNEVAVCENCKNRYDAKYNSCPHCG